MLFEYIFSWGVISVIVPIIFGLGYTMMQYNSPIWAQISFSTAAVIFITKFIWWIAVNPPVNINKITTLIVSFFVVGMAGVIWVSCLVWTNTIGSNINKLPRFSVEVRSAMVSDNGPRTAFMVGHQSSFGNTVSPIFYLAYIQLTNTQNIPISINDMNIAASKDPNGPWEDLLPIPLSSVDLFFLSDSKNPPPPKFLVLSHGTYRLAEVPTEGMMKTATVLKALDILERELVNPINPHASIRGWVALDSLRHAGLTPGVIYFRIKLRDNANREDSPYIIQLPRKQPGDTSLDVECGKLLVAGEMADISGHHLKYYSDPFPVPSQKQ